MAADMPLISCVPHFPSFLKGWMRFQIMPAFENWFLPLRQILISLGSNNPSLEPYKQGHKQKKGSRCCLHDAAELKS